MGGVVLFALLTGSAITHGQTERMKSTSKRPPAVHPIPFAQGPQQYGLADLPKAAPHDFLWGDHKPEADLIAQKTLEPPKDKTWREAPLATSTNYANDIPDPDQVARLSPILFGAQANAGKPLQTSSGLADVRARRLPDQPSTSGGSSRHMSAPPRSASRFSPAMSFPPRSSPNSILIFPGASSRR